MIKSTKLRIGNLVIKRTETDCGYHTEYSKITPSIISSAASDGEIDFIEPIPLTPEILEKAGFERPNDFYDLRLLHDTFGLCSLEYDSKRNIVYLDFEGTQAGCEIAYLHQLQNLYFALTGEELEINL